MLAQFINGFDWGIWLCGAALPSMVTFIGFVRLFRFVMRPSPQQVASAIEKFRKMNPQMKMPTTPIGAPK